MNVDLTRATRGLALLLALLASATIAASEPSSIHSRLRLIEGIDADGDAVSLWVAVMTKRHPEGLDRVDSRRMLTPSERAWTNLVQSKLAAWEQDIPALSRNFTPAEGPDVAVIVVGNRGGEDAFTHDATTIAFDASRLLALYGEAGLPENGERIDRLFRHEYSHLLQKAWLAVHPYAARTPLQAALLDIWSEGIGNYYSLSTQWRSTKGKPSTLAAEALERLVPRLVARLAALSCAPDAPARPLSATLSSGPFDRKWGALPVALWLELDTAQSEDTLRSFIAAGPDGVWTFLERHLPKELREVLREIREAASLCSAL